MALAAAVAVPMTDPPPIYNVGGDDDTVVVSGFEGEQERRAEEAKPPGQRKYRYKRTAKCQLQPASDQPCPQINPGLPPLSLTCEAGEPIAPLWRQSIASPHEGWQLRAPWACPEDMLPMFTREDLQALKIAPLQVSQQPRSGPMLITKPVIVYTKPTEREFHVVLFDVYGVDVIVTPREYTWDFGDGYTITTTDPGRPYPSFDIAHPYEELGEARITLTTTWTAKYRLEDDPLGRWLDADGSVTTTHEGVEFEVIELRSTLVD